MRIALSGVQGSGKSTLAGRLVELLPNWSHYGESTRSVKAMNLPINEAGTDTTQLVIANKHIDNLFSCYNSESDSYNMVTDRCLLDVLAYTKRFMERGLISEWVHDYVCNLAFHYMKEYDIIFIAQLEFALEDDGVRSTSEEFLDDIQNKFNVLTENWDTDRLYDEGDSGEYPKLIYLTGTVEERLETILKEVK